MSHCAPHCEPDTLGRYVAAIKAQNPKAAADCFTPDDAQLHGGPIVGSKQTPTFPPSVGREQLIQGYSAAFANGVKTITFPIAQAPEKLEGPHHRRVQKGTFWVLAEDPNQVQSKKGGDFMCIYTYWQGQWYFEVCMHTEFWTEPIVTA